MLKPKKPHALIQVNEETDCLMVVDLQETFMPAGGLAVPQGNLIVPTIKRVLPAFPNKRLRVASKDRHIKGHVSIATSYNDVAPFQAISYQDSLAEGFAAKLGPRLELEPYQDYLRRCRGQMQIVWPEHGLAGTDEAELHPDLPESTFGYVLIKGADKYCDSYSAFKDNLGRRTEMTDVLRDRGVQRIFMVGLAFDFCVGWSAEDAVDDSFEVYVIADAVKSVDLPPRDGKPGSVAATVETLFRKGVRIIQSTDLIAA